MRHDLSLAQKSAEKAPFKIRLSDSSSKLLDHLNDYGRFRYLETSYFIHGPKLVELDKAIWEVRRYCRVLNYELKAPGKDPIPMLDMEIKRNEEAEKRPFQEFHVFGGALEAILQKGSHPARSPLIWQNGFYGSSRRKRVTVPTYFFAENAPLSMYPEILDHVLEYVYLPKDVIDVYRTAS